MNQAEDKTHGDDIEVSPQEPQAKKAKPKPPVEIGGRQGPDPVRYGDWEKAGRAIDF